MHLPILIGIHSSEVSVCSFSYYYEQYARNQHWYHFVSRDHMTYYRVTRPSLAWPDLFLALGVIAFSISASGWALILQAITPSAKKEVWPRETRQDHSFGAVAYSRKRSRLLFEITRKVQKLKCLPEAILKRM